MLNWICFKQSEDFKMIQMVGIQCKNASPPSRPSRLEGVSQRAPFHPQVASAEMTLKNFETELAKLNHIINEADADRFQQKKEYDITINERDILGTQVTHRNPSHRPAPASRQSLHVLARLQLIRRNDELALLYQKVKIQQETVSRGEVAYRDKVEDLRVLHLKHNALRRELHIQKVSRPTHAQQPWLCAPSKARATSCLFSTPCLFHGMSAPDQSSVERHNRAIWTCCGPRSTPCSASFCRTARR